MTGVEQVGNAIHATFRRNHEPGFEVGIAGNPGPQRDFDVRAARYEGVIRFAASLR